MILASGCRRRFGIPERTRAVLGRCLVVLVHLRILPCRHLCLIELPAAIEAFGKLALHVAPRCQRLLDTFQMSVD
jgi:hypothetical protein